MRENRDFVVPVNILTPFAHVPFSWAHDTLPDACKQATTVTNTDVYIRSTVSQILFTLNSLGAVGLVPVSTTYTLEDDNDGRTSLLRDLLASPKQLQPTD